MTAGQFLVSCCAVLYAGIGVWIAWASRRVAPMLLAFCCLVTAAWAVIVMVAGPGPSGAMPSGVWGGGVQGGADLVRALAWYGFVFYLYHDARLGRPGHEAGFALAALVAAGVGVSSFLVDQSVHLPGSAFSLAIMARLTLAVAELLLIENLYLNLPDHARWHVALPSVLLGGLACFDILLCAELVLFHQPSGALEGARTLVMIMVAPLLMVAGVRGQRWRGKVKLSRTAVFHSATLVLSGGVLLALGSAGEVFRHLGGEWGWLAEVSLAFAALMALALLVTSGSARSRFQRLVVDHFFAERFDYRRQWQACIRMLSGDDGDLQSALAMRAIRTVVSVVDSSAGILFLREAADARLGVGPFSWAGSWNLPATEAVPAVHPLVEALQDGAWVPRLDGPERAALRTAPLDGVGPVWLAVPLVHRGMLIGFVVTAPPRAPFDLVQEVFDLLRIVAQEVATFIAEQRATQTLLQTRQLHDYSQRFAFVAHDIKNVSSQLALLVSNAEHHLANPEFQKDMLETVRASVRKITDLLQRLERPEPSLAPTSLAPLPLLEALVRTYQRVRKAQLVLEHDGSTASISMGHDAFETAVTHLLNNAVEASAGQRVVMRVRHEVNQVVVEIVDSGPGMEPEFLRDKLFQPFSTSKSGGSGIGAYQARQLIRTAGGELTVASEPGRGTTMRLQLPRTDIRALQVQAARTPILSGAEP